MKQIWVCASNKMSKPPSPCCHRACTLSPIEIGKRCSSLVHSKSEQHRTRMLLASTSLSPLSYTTSYLALRPRPCTFTTCACVHEVVCVCMRAHESACTQCMKAHESTCTRERMHIVHLHESASERMHLMNESTYTPCATGLACMCIDSFLVGVCVCV